MVKDYSNRKEIIFQKQPPLAFYEKATEKPKLTSENYKWRSLFWTSLIYNMSAKQERHECDTSDISATRVQHKQHECDTNDATVTLVRL